MKFKTIAAATLAVATMLGMGACGSSTGAKDDKTITFWHNATAGDGKQLLGGYGQSVREEDRCQGSDSGHPK